MCLVVLAYKMSPRYRLVVAANRDEFLNRPTAALGYLDDHRTVVGGRDLRGGGTWLGIAKDLRFGVITNYRDPNISRPVVPSRGGLILDYLQDQWSAADYLHSLSPKRHRYAGFNLLVSDDRGLYYSSSISGEITALQPGFYGLSNGLLDTPWPKLTRAKRLLKSLLVGVENIDREAVLQRLGDDFLPEDGLLPDTGVGLRWERLLASIFIDGPGYGTRSSAILSMSYGGDVVFTEQSYHRTGVLPLPTSMIEYQFTGF